MNFAHDLLEARGEIDPDGPEAEAFVLADVKDVVMHEVGHALGLRHNFRASMIYSQTQLNDADFTRDHGIAGSVMEYNAVNIALSGERQGSYGMNTLGPYDYWAIEYGYADRRGETARSAEDHRKRPFLGGQFPLQARVHAAHASGLSRSKRRLRRRTVDAGRGLFAHRTGAGDSTHRPRQSDERNHRATDSRQ